MYEVHEFCKYAVIFLIVPMLLYLVEIVTYFKKRKIEKPIPSSSKESPLDAVFFETKMRVSKRASIIGWFALFSAFVCVMASVDICELLGIVYDDGDMNVPNIVGPALMAAVFWVGFFCYSFQKEKEQAAINEEILSMDRSMMVGRLFGTEPDLGPEEELLSRIEELKELEKEYH